MITNTIYKEFTDMTISKWTFIQKNMESNIFLYKSNIITSYILLFRKETSYITELLLRVIYYVTSYKLPPTLGNKEFNPYFWY